MNRLRRKSEINFSFSVHLKIKQFSLFGFFFSLFGLGSATTAVNTLMKRTETSGCSQHRGLRLQDGLSPAVTALAAAFPAAGAQWRPLLPVVPPHIACE